MLRVVRSLALLAVLVSLGTGLWTWAHRLPPLPCADCNVLLISIDTLRADHLTVYGYERPTSPFLASLAREAVVFEQVFNYGGFTLPEHVAILTSIPPGVHGIVKIDDVLEPERVTLAEQLRAAGRRTAAFTDGAWMSAHFGLAQGFESYDDAGGGLAETLPKALDWIAAHRHEPWFLFLHTYDVHTRSSGQPYDCPGDWGERFLPRTGEPAEICFEDHCGVVALTALVRRRRVDPSFPLREHVTPYQIDVLRAEYDNCIRWADARLRELVARLKTWGLYERTLIVVTSDHGEKFLEHDQLLHDGEPYDPLVRVPLLMKLPGGRHGGRRVDALVSSIDTMPTTLRAVGVPPNEDVHGHDLLPLLDDGMPRRQLVNVGRGVRSERWKLIRGRRGHDHRLYDLLADPRETRDVAARHHDQARGLAQADRIMSQREQRHQRDFQRRLTGRERPRPPRPSAEDVERLRALGYLD